MSLLEIKDLAIEFPGTAAPAVNHTNLTIAESESLGLVGESGSGKSMTALSVLGLLPTAARVTSGSILFEGEDLLAAPEDRLREVRGAKISMIFQEPFTSLNPIHTVGRQVAEAVELHQGLDGQAAMARAVQWLDRVGIREPDRRARQYPHQFSGGMRQRAMIAMALACGPKLLIADEPTTALDVTVQVQVLDLILDLKKEMGLGLLMISHDLGVIVKMAERTAVMKDGKIVEQGETVNLIKNPGHDYTRQLLAAYRLWEGAA